MSSEHANGDMKALEQKLSRLAREPHLLVACDYDGTLAPIVDVPGEARPRRESVAALRALAALTDTSVAVISGRSLHDLAALSRLPEEIHLVGSHGTEFDVGFARALSPEALALRDRVTEELHAIAALRTGVIVEHKPAGVALHYRQASEEDSAAALAAVREGPALLPGVHAREGKQVIELAVVEADKGYALDAIRHQVGATAALFVGDDVTDEDAFSRLTGPDLGIKVGLGPTFAAERVEGPDDVARLLARLVESRREWLAGANSVPIERHAILADGKTVALVTPDARITWLCHPRPDSAPLFAELVGGRSGGSLAVRPAHEGAPTAQRYLDGTLTLETRWAGLTVRDYLDRGDPYGRVRLVRVLEGSAEAIIEFIPRPDFGRTPVGLRVDPDGVVVLGAADPVALYAPGLTWEIEDDGVQSTARAHILGDRPYVIELRCGSDSLAPHPTPEPERRERTEHTWRSWLEGLRLPALARPEVARSALTLRALCHEQTGAILAAATTSLPEEIGGVRNWDYRYCWLRDAAITAMSLVELGSTGEAYALLGYIERLADTEQGAERLRPLYSVMGGYAGTEAVIDAVPGYAGSRPVRVGNAAALQVQLDVFGPIVELVYELAVAGGKLAESHHLLVEQIVDAVARRWDEPDHGIWEVRRPPRHHVHSRVDVLARGRPRAATRPPHRAARARRAGRCSPTASRPTSWSAVGSPRCAAFTAAYDGVDLDAAALQIGLCGLLPADDERFAATVEAIELRLREGPTVYRYRSDDGLPGSEGGFHLCALWLAHAYALVGRQSDAQALFDQVVELAGPHRPALRAIRPAGRARARQPSPGVLAPRADPRGTRAGSAAADDARLRGCRGRRRPLGAPAASQRARGAVRGGRGCARRRALLGRAVAVCPLARGAPRHARAHRYARAGARLRPGPAVARGRAARGRRARERRLGRRTRARGRERSPHARPPTRDAAGRPARALRPARARPVRPRAGRRPALRLHARIGDGLPDPADRPCRALRVRLAGLGDPAGRPAGGAGLPHRAVATGRRGAAAVRGRAGLVGVGVEPAAERLLDARPRARSACAPRRGGRSAGHRPGAPPLSA